MTDTMLVRAAGGGWEELKPQTEMPEGGIVDVFGEDIGPVLGAATSVVVVACAPPLALGAPDAICVDPEGGIWIVQSALDGTGEQTLPQLMAFGGALTGMAYDAFEAMCERTDGESLSGFLEARAGSFDFHGSTFEVAVADALAHGRFRLVAIVRHAAPALVQSMKFLNASGAMGSVYEAMSYSSASVSAVRATAIDVGGGVGVAPSSPDAASAAPAAEPSAPAKSSGSGKNNGAAAFIAAVGKTTDDATASLMAQLQKACLAACDDVRYEGTGAKSEMRAEMRAPEGPAAMVVATADGGVVLSFEALGSLDPSWNVRAELCQGMERLLGADLGDVRKISQLNLSIAEHLMDATLMEALTELLSDTTGELRQSTSDDARDDAREPAAA